MPGQRSLESKTGPSQQILRLMNSLSVSLRMGATQPKQMPKPQPIMDAVIRRLRRRPPLPPRSLGVVHGDYRIGNMLSGEDAEVKAVLDWELCTLGDTLADVGYIMNNWGQPGDPEIAEGDVSPTAIGGFPSRAEFIEAYSKRTGHEVTNVDYYRSFQFWRLAAIVEGVLSRYLKGVMGDDNPDTAVFNQRIDRLAESALRLVRSLG